DGEFISYGVREAADVRAWSDWLNQTRPGARQFGLGRSMGAAILLQAVAAGCPFRSVVAECPFATFEEIAYDRLTQRLDWPRAAWWPLVRIAMWYTSLRYGIDLRQASPAQAVQNANIPILLIHGMDDTNIPIRHSRQLLAANPRICRLWE